MTPTHSVSIECVEVKQINQPNQHDFNRHELAAAVVAGKFSFRYFFFKKNFILSLLLYSLYFTVNNYQLISMWLLVFHFSTLFVDVVVASNLYRFVVECCRCVSFPI